MQRKNVITLPDKLDHGKLQQLRLRYGFALPSRQGDTLSLFEQPRDFGGALCRRRTAHRYISQAS